MEEGSKQNRQYQDSVFVYLFTNDKEKLLSLCKALDSSIVSDDIDLIKIENTLYTGIKNGVSCKIENRLIFIIEHQSTVNENMPLRCLEYIAKVLDRIVKTRSRYARRLIKIPTPEFYVFIQVMKSYLQWKIYNFLKLLFNLKRIHNWSLLLG